MRETEKARLVVDDDNNQVWIPKSQFVTFNHRPNKTFVAEVNEWIMNGKNFLTFDSRPTWHGTTENPPVSDYELIDDDDADDEAREMDELDAFDRFSPPGPFDIE